MMINTKRLRDSFKNAFVGMGHAWYSQQNLRIQIIFGGIAIIAGIFFHLSLLEWLLILSSIIGVIVAELINTAVELTIDLITTKKNKRAQLTKDVSSAAVLFIVVWSIIIGIVVFIPKIIGAFN